MKIILKLHKSFHENINDLYEKIKKKKKKIQGAQLFLEKLDKKDAKKQEQPKVASVETESGMWYDAFKHSKTSSGKLFVFGKDAQSNEKLIKKHMEPSDYVFHTEEPGSPFALCREEPSKEDAQEISAVIGAFSKMWKKGYGSVDAFYVRGTQVKKTEGSMKAGSFAIEGKKDLVFNVPLTIGFGVMENEQGNEAIFVGSIMACKEYCKRFVKLEPGREKYKQIQKTIKDRLRVHVQDLPRFVPQHSKILKK